LICLKALDAVVVALNAALYAGVGYVFYFVFPLFCPGLSVVRFWPVVVIPAVFAVLFGPLVGGVGAAIGIFISDMFIHGNALLSLVAGVPSNFLGFYLIGYITRKNLGWTKLLIGLGAGCLALIYVSFTWLPVDIALLFSGIVVGSYIVILVIGHVKPKWKGFEVASMVGLLVGSTIIGFTVWAFSQYFILPSGDMQLPLYASLVWLVWTFATEIPFLVVLGPPIIEACYKAFPALKLSEKATDR